MGIRRALLSFPKSVLGVLLYFIANGATEAATRPAYTEILYPSGGLKIQAYLYKPAGDRPLPADIYKRRAVPHREAFYEPFAPRGSASDTPPGHRAFSLQGVKIWGKDVLDFLGRFLGKTPAEKN